MKLSEELQWRGFHNQTTYKSLKDIDEGQTKFYWGVDPSAPSMTIGNLAAAMMARVFIKHGYTPYLLVGGATGMIGDPDGKKQERDLMDMKTLNDNKKAIAAQYKQIFDGHKFEVVDNYDWFKSINYLDFLREVGKHMSMTQLLDREFVKARVGKDGAGISYAEFSYALIQGYDFYHLFKNHGVTLQLSGADQWGNSLAGVEIIRKLTSETAHVYTTPLVVNKTTGKKFGKTEDGAIWLNEEFTSIFDFYQFWLNVDDDGVGDYLKIYTDISEPEYTDVMEEFERGRSHRKAQRELAYRVTAIVHGKSAAEAAVEATEALFKGKEKIGLKARHLLKKHLPTTKKKEITEALLDSSLVSSKSDARRMLKAGAVSVNGERVDQEFMLPHGFSILKVGKNKFAIAEQ